MTDVPDRLTTALADRYRIQRKLGEGGMASVYLADDLKHSRKVAIKVLKPELAAVVGAERFLAEIQTTANLQHPHILPLFDSGDADGFLFYVMPFVEGESLRDRLNREKQLPVEEAVRIAADVGEALHAAHERGVIHRDIKPANILMSGGRPLVADFGIALAVSNAGGGRLTETGLSMGTPYYMSPEQASADRDPTQTSDQYSLACVLYEMLVGEPPFSGGTAQAVLARILTGNPEPPSTLRKSVPPNVDAVVMRGLERLPADRFPDAREMVRALRDVDHRYLSGGQRSPAGSGSGGLSSILPWGVTAVLAALLAANLLTGGVSSSSEQPPIHSAIPMQEESLIPLGPLLPFGGDASAFDVTRDGRTLVHLGWDGEGIRVYRRPLDGYASTPLEGTEGASDIFLSPDGQWVGYFRDGGVWKASLTGGDPVRIANVSNPVGGFWGDDDIIRFTTMEGGRVVAVSALGGEVSQVAEGSWFEAPGPVPGGGFVVHGSTPHRMSVWTPEGEGVPLGDGSQPIIHPSGLITFVRGRTLYAAGIDLDTWEFTTSPTPVLEGIRSGTSARSYRITQDGTLFYLPGAYSQVTVPSLVDAAGRADTLPIPPAEYGHLAISPDLTRIATYEVSTEFEVSVFDIASGRMQLIDRAYGASQVLWSRAGDRIVYARQKDEDADWELVVRSPDSTAETVIYTSPFEMTPSDWSPDDTSLLFAEWTDTAGGQTHIVALESGAEPELILGDPDADEWGATLSPDGRWLAYTSDRGGAYEIYLTSWPVPEDGGAVKVSTQTPAEEPHWTFSGDEILYRESSRWWRVPVRFTPAPTAANPELVTEGPFINVPGKSWDLLPDGRLLMGDGPRDATVNRIHMIPNFMAEVERRLAEAGR